MRLCEFKIVGARIFRQLFPHRAKFCEGPARKCTQNKGLKKEITLSVISNEMYCVPCSRKYSQEFFVPMNLTHNLLMRSLLLKFRAIYLRIESAARILLKNAASTESVRIENVTVKINHVLAPY